MKKNFFVVISMLIAVSFLLAGCGGQKTQSGTEDSKEQVYQFDYNIQAPPTHKFVTAAMEPWAKLVEEKTNGRIKINLHTSGALGALSTAYDDIKGGVYDIGYVVPSYHKETDLFPLTIGELPFGLSEPKDVTNVLGKFNEKYMMDIYKDVKYLSVTSTDSYQIVSKDPVKSIEDVKNKKINAIGDQNVKLVESWGGVPVSLGVGEMYEALERQTVDQVVYPAIGSVGFKLNEIAPNLTKIDVNAMSLVFLMNQDSFNKLPEDLQKIFGEELAPKLAEMAGDMYTNEQEKMIQEFESQGGNIITIADGELQKFKEQTKVLWEDWVKIANDKGYPAQEMMDYYIQLLEEAGLETPM